MSFSIHSCNISHYLFISACCHHMSFVLFYLLLLLCGGVHTSPGPDDVIKALRFCHKRLEKLYLEQYALYMNLM